MTKIKKAVVVIQKTSPIGRRETYFRVERLTNLTEPPIASTLTDEEVHALIGSGITVTVKGEK